MKTRFGSGIASISIHTVTLGGLALVTLTGERASASAATWRNVGTDWATSGNWNPSGPPVANETATFGFVTSADIKNPNLAAPATVGTLSIDNSDADYSVTQTGSQTLTLSTIASPPKVLVITGGGTTNIAPQIATGGTKTFDTGSTAVTLQGGLATVTGSDLTLTLANSTKVVVSGNVTNNDAGTARTITLDGAGSMEVTGSVTGGTKGISLGSTANFSGTLTLSKANSLTNDTVWRAGTLAINADSALGGKNISLGTATSGTNSVAVLTSGAYSVGANFSVNLNPATKSFTIGGTQTTGTSTYTGTVNLSNITKASSGGLNLTSAAGGTVIFGGAISGASTTADFVTKIGEGTVQLTAANTYAGGTEVKAGTLLVDNTTGSGTGSAGVNVTGGSLGGKGTIAGAVSVSSGSLAPAEHAALVLQNGLSFTGGGLNIDIGGNSSYDAVQVTSGDIALGSGLASLSLTQSFSPTANGTFWVLDNTGSGSLSGYFAGLASSGATVPFAGGNVYKIYYNANHATNSLSGGNDVAITVAVPEPGSLALIGIGIAGLLWRRRKAAEGI